jgi:tetratricopeptide (TPR) repeat protein
MDIHLNRDFLPHTDERFQRATQLEREAQQYHSQGEIDKAFHAYDKAAGLYRDLGEHFKAALCFAASATCWNIHTGWQPLKNAATRSHFAAEEALKAGHYQYASSLFREAALLYAKEGDDEHHTACYLLTKRSLRQVYLESVLRRQAAGEMLLDTPETIGERARNLVRYGLSLFYDLLWGYGMLPFRMLGGIVLVICFCAFIYTFAGHPVSVNGVTRGISFIEGLYFSAITFATVGYGDYLPLGWLRLVAVWEALSGIIMMALFLVALTRRYLR